MKNIFDTLTEKYDVWYDPENGRPLYEAVDIIVKGILK